ncbi:MAG: zinc ribbon domain-containing protein [Actinomycetota bacterium]|nr:zinc ribbon domain-containing protein [Actinomycetota bacterium]
MRRPHWRKMTWVLVIWSALILVWAIAGGSSAANDCANQTGSQFLSAHDAQQACNAGAGIGVAAILGIGFFGFVFLALIWLMTRSRGRDCPACGESAKRGTTICKNCGHDFAAAARAGVPLRT